MQTLFPLDAIYPEGFSYEPGFLSSTEEEELLAAVQELSLSAFVFQGYEAKRRVASFGLDYSFDKGALLKGSEIPPAFRPAVEKVAAHLGIAAGAFEELLVTEYPPGSVINWHRDAPPFDLIAGLSLLSDCRFRLRPQAPEKQVRRATISLTVQRRSLYVMKGPARSEWQHSISPVAHTRYSVTLRTLRKS
ncbi:MAG: 2OG-Fe(II) oxygenase [Flaviaesturariibacter sp.]|nr:2OG-Fe(II) oxygenase [Flaviaesturariibacter sp.]